MPEYVCKTCGYKVSRLFYEWKHQTGSKTKLKPCKEPDPIVDIFPVGFVFVNGNKKGLSNPPKPT